MTEHHFTIELIGCGRYDFQPFTAEVVLGGAWSLYDFAEFIIKTVGFDFDHAFEFGDNLKRPYRSKERYTLFADIGEARTDDEQGVKDTRVSEVFRPKRKMVFLFDYGDDWVFHVTCTAVKPSEKQRRFRRVLTTLGTPPEQYPDPDA